MNSSIDLNQLKPKLKACDIDIGESKIVLEDIKTQSQLILPREHKRMLDLFTGELSVREIISELYNTDGRVSFNSIITTIHLLRSAKLLENDDLQMEQVRVDKGPHEQKSSILIRPLIDMVLVNKVAFKFLKSTIAFSILAVLILASIALPVYLFPEDGFWKFNFASFLKSGGGYEGSLIRLILISSGLIAAKAIIRSILLLFAAGGFRQFALRINFFSISFRVNDTIIYSGKRWMLILYGVTSALLYLFIATLFVFLFPQFINWDNDVKLMAILLTLIELDPYRQSELTKIFHFFYADDQLKSLMPYLKNCSLSFGDSGKRFIDELRFVIYSILAMAWAVGFTLFAMDLIVDNISDLMFAVQVGTLINQISAGVILLFLLFIFGYLFIDLFHTVFTNVVFPLTVPFGAMFKSSKKYKASDIDEHFIHTAIKKNIFLKDLSDSTIDFIVKNAKVKKLKSGKMLMVQGTSGREMYLLLKGNAEVSVRDNTGRMKPLVQLRPNSLIGEQAILSRVEHSVNVKALENIVFLDIGHKLIEDIVRREDLKNDLENLRSRIEISQFVSSAGIFNDFPPEIMNIFVEAGDLVNFPKGGEIVTEGEDDKTFYMLLRGSVQILKGEVEVAKLGKGDFFGEIALIANSKRTATVRTLEDTLLLYIEDKQFWKILSENIELAMYLESVGRHRMSDGQDV